MIDKLLTNISQVHCNIKGLIQSIALKICAVVQLKCQGIVLVFAETAFTVNGAYIGSIGNKSRYNADFQQRPSKEKYSFQNCVPCCLSSEILLCGGVLVKLFMQSPLQASKAYPHREFYPRNQRIVILPFQPAVCLMQFHVSSNAMKKSHKNLSISSHVGKIHPLFQCQCHLSQRFEGRNDNSLSIYMPVSACLEYTMTMCRLSMENMFSRLVYPLTFTCNAVIKVYFFSLKMMRPGN